MSRFHVHLHVRDLEQSVRFSIPPAGTAPTRVELGYAKWMLEEPKVNFAVSTGEPVGISHLGFQVETEDELTEVSSRAQAAAGTVLVEKGAAVATPQGTRRGPKIPRRGLGDVPYHRRSRRGWCRCGGDL